MFNIFVLITNLTLLFTYDSRQWVSSQNVNPLTWGEKSISSWYWLGNQAPPPEYSHRISRRETTEPEWFLHFAATSRTVFSFSLGANWFSWRTIRSFLFPMLCWASATSRGLRTAPPYNTQSRAARKTDYSSTFGLACFFFSSTAAFGSSHTKTRNSAAAILAPAIFLHPVAEQLDCTLPTPEYGHTTLCQGNAHGFERFWSGIADSEEIICTALHCPDTPWRKLKMENAFLLLSSSRGDFCFFSDALRSVRFPLSRDDVCDVFSQRGVHIRRHMNTVRSPNERSIQFSTFPNM